MGVAEIIGGIVMVLVSIGIIISVLLQESPKGGGLNALTGSDSYYNKNQGRSMDAMILRMTKYLAIAFFLVTIIVYAIDVVLK